MKKTHFMLDIETAGNRPDAVVTEIAMVCFNPNTGEEIDSYHEYVDAKDCTDLGCTVDLSTLQFRFLAGSKDLTFPGMDVANCLQSLGRFMENNEPNIESRVVWCKGASFRFPIISNLMALTIGKNIPPTSYPTSSRYPLWMFRNQMCVRPFYLIDPEASENLSFIGVRHDALCDARHQVQVLTYILKSLSLNGNKISI